MSPFIRPGMRPGALDRALSRVRRMRATGPEHNVVQSPELLQRLARVLGLRQMHLVPSLSETVQPVVLLHDLTLNPTENLPTYRQAQQVQVVTGTLFAQWFFQNPVGSNTIARVYSITFAPLTANVVRWGIAPLNAVLSLGAAFRTDSIHPPYPAVSGARTSICQMTNSVAAVAGSATMDWGIFGNQTIRAPEVVSPRNLVVAPGAQFLVGTMDAGVNLDNYAVTMEWTEEELTAPGK